MSLLFLACEEERLPGDGGNVAAKSDAVPVKFNVELELGSETEYVPMTRAGEPDPVLTQLNPSHPYILLKLVDNAWYIDQIGDWSIGVSGDIKSTDKPVFSPLSLELRPGTYRLSVVLNGERLTRDKSFKTGSRVADATTADKDFPCLFTYFHNSKGEERGLKGLKIPLLRCEIFSGYTEFIVNKNNDLHTAEPVRSFVIPLTRKVGQIQFLMKRTPGKAGGVSKTAYWLVAKMKATSGQPFCEGLNVLGLPYFNPSVGCTELGYFSSTTPASSQEEGVKDWRTDAKGRQYQIGETGSTDAAFFWLTDPANAEGVPFEMEVIAITGQGSGPYYQYNGSNPVPKKLIANQACGIAFESTGTNVPGGGDNLYYLQLATDDDAGNTLDEADFLFPPYYIWNQSMFVE